MAQASAADLPAPQAPATYYRAPPPIVFNWTGFYGGINGGYRWGSSNHSIRTYPSRAASDHPRFRRTVGLAASSSVTIGKGWVARSCWEFDFDGFGQSGTGT
jgi:hypothetical protein